MSNIYYLWAILCIIYWQYYILAITYIIYRKWPRFKTTLTYQTLLIFTEITPNISIEYGQYYIYFRLAIYNIGAILYIIYWPYYIYNISAILFMIYGQYFIYNIWAILFIIYGQYYI